jgi:serine/threonine protein kinase
MREVYIEFEDCDQTNLSTSDRLDLFIQICQAIQHAHQKGIIHRDIKPSNILVNLHDGVAVPKVIDFGIAKATTDQRLTDKTVFTAFNQFIGTPAYMSPEQAELSGLDIDTRGDIYSLGVLLYELWQAAATDLSEALKLDPDFPAFELGPLLVEIGDTPGYKSFRRHLLAKFNVTQDPPTAAEVAMGMLIGSGEFRLSPPTALLELIAAQDTNDVQLAYFRLVKALAEYRQGRFSSSHEWSEKSLATQTIKSVTAVAAGAVLAMAQQQLKRLDAARKTLAQAVDLAQTKLPKVESGDLGEDWPEWLIARILSREARVLIEGGTNAPNDPPKQK